MKISCLLLDKNGKAQVAHRLNREMVQTLMLEVLAKHSSHRSDGLMCMSREGHFC